MIRRLIILLLIVGCGGNDEDRWQYTDKFSRIDKKTGESWTKIEVDSPIKTDFTPEIKQALDKLREEMIKEHFDDSLYMSSINSSQYYESMYRSLKIQWENG
jgi:hypothetical protein